MKNCEHALSGARQTRRPLHYFLLGSVSMLSIGLALPAQAQTDQNSTVTNAVSQENQPVETVVVTGRRAALQSAQEIKANSDQIVDAVVADQAGKLPDNSITEVLSRVPGVTIGRFSAVNNPDVFSVEGSGVAVRGLTQVSSTLNGRSAFSANGGRSLAWEDVPPELMSAVSVYKSPTPDQIEGGIGGSVDLRTHMPFDFDGFAVNGAVSENYGDFGGQTRPAASALISDRWNTKIGEIGVLFDLAYSDIDSRSDTFQVEPYYLHTLYSNPDGSANAAGVSAFVPGGVDWRTNMYDRKRLGAYEAIQWKPTDRLTIYQTFFQSNYHYTSSTYAMYDSYSNGSSATVPLGATYTLSPSDLVTSTSALDLMAGAAGGYAALPNEACPTTVPNCTVTFNNTGVDKSNIRTTDIAAGFQWDATDHLYVSGAFQYTHSTDNDIGLDLFSNAMVSDLSFKSNGGELPTVVMSDPSLAADPTRQTWDAEMDHLSQHWGSQITENLDAKYDLGAGNFFTAIKAGIRYADLKDTDWGGAGGKYNWHSLTPTWLTCCGGTFNYLSDASPGDATLVKFDNFFRGEIKVPAQVYLPSLALANTYDPKAIAAKYGYAPFGMNTDSGALDLLPTDLSTSSTRTKAVYLMADFGMDDVFGMVMNGNIGARVVSNANQSVGYITRQATTWIIGGTPYAIDATAVSTGGGYHYTKVLPSFNIQFLPQDNIHLRFAASQSMANPSFGQLAASGSGIGFNGCPGTSPGAGAVIIDPTGACYKGTATLPLSGTVNGDPFLRPQISDNVDISAEWYGQNQASVHAGLFLKSIHNYLAYGTFNGTAQVPLPTGGLSAPLALQTNGWYNETGVATVRGFELGGTKYFDFLPAPFDGLGVDGNFTYIDSRSPGSQSCQIFIGTPTSALCGGYQAISGLPVEQLSKYNYNLSLMYDKGPWSGRLAYNWRSKYMLVSSGANGTKTLPVFSAPYGQLDGSVEYKLNDHFRVSVDAQNITHTLAYTLMGFNSPTYGNLQAPRNWFVSDTHYILSLKFNY